MGIISEAREREEEAYKKGIIDGKLKALKPYECFKFLESCTDEQFAEVFAYLDLSSFGRFVPEADDKKALIANMDVNALCLRLKVILTEIKYASTEQ